MPRKQKKYHYIYKTTNILNDKFYIGMHSTNDLNDGYIGSGKRLWYSINKHGKENHICEILEYLPDKKLLREREEEIVNEKLLKDDLCMNLTKGGYGGWYTANRNYPLVLRISNGKKSQKKMKWLRENDAEWRNRTSKKLSIGVKLAIKEGRLIPPPLADWTGRHHLEFSKQKISITNKGRGLGNLNSQYNTCWIYSLKKRKSIKIPKCNLEQYIKNGWIKGRKMNFK